MDPTSLVHDSDNESNPDVLVLDTDHDFPLVEDTPSSAVNHNKIGSVWRDMVIGEQMEGCLTRLEVTTKTAGYTDMDDPHYMPMNNVKKRKRSFSLVKSNKNTKNIKENGISDLESNHVVKKRYSRGNGNFNKCNYKYANTKEFVDKRDNSDSKTECRILPAISDSEEKTTDEFLNELCTNLHEQNKVLMFSMISKIDRKIIIEKYNKTCLIEANGGQMIKNGNRRRTSGGVFFSLIKEDKSIPNSAKKDLYGPSPKVEIKKNKRKQKMKRKKEKLKKMITRDKKEADHLKKLKEEQKTLPINHVIENELCTISSLNDNKLF